MRLRLRVLTTFLPTIALVLAVPAGGDEPASANYRLVAPTHASVAARPQSASYRLLIAGGSGQVAGLSASLAFSTYAGTGSAVLPTDRLFEDGVE